MPERRTRTVQWRASCARPLSAGERAECERLFGLFYQRLHSQGQAPSTVVGDRRRLSNALACLGIPPWEWTSLRVDEYLAHFATVRGNSNGTQLHKIQTLRGFQNFLLGEVGLCNQLHEVYGQRPQRFINEINSIAFKRKGHQRVRIVTPLSAEQVDRLIAEFDFQIQAARKAGSKAFRPLCRDKAMTQLALLTGVRVAELVSIRTVHFFPDAKHPAFGDFAILRVIGKGAKERAIRLFNPCVRDIMTHYLDIVRPHLQHATGKDPSLLFLSERRGGSLTDVQFRRRLKRVARAAGLPMTVHPHLLRHTYGTQMAPLIGPEALQRQMGHAHLSTTLSIYYHQDLEMVGQEVQLGIEKVTAMIDAAVYQL